jgi:hypothetical protein
MSVENKQQPGEHIKPSSHSAELGFVWLQLPASGFRLRDFLRLITGCPLRMVTGDAGGTMGADPLLRSGCSSCSLGRKVGVNPTVLFLSRESPTNTSNSDRSQKPRKELGLQRVGSLQQNESASYLRGANLFPIPARSPARSSAARAGETQREDAPPWAPGPPRPPGAPRPGTPPSRPPPPVARALQRRPLPSPAGFREEPQETHPTFRLLQRVHVGRQLQSPPRLRPHRSPRPPPGPQRQLPPLTAPLRPSPSLRPLLRPSALIGHLYQTP